MKRLFAILAVACLGTQLPAGEPSVPPDPGLVRVLVTYQEFNQFLPWMPERPKERGGYGIPIAPGRLLTTERLLRNHRLVELQKARSGEKIAARVDMADPKVNLALLRFDDSAALAGLSPVPLVERAPRDAELEILQFFDSGEVERIKTPIRRISVAGLPESPFSSLTFTVQTETSINGEGAPAMLGGRLAGLAMTYDRGARTAGVIPYPVIRRFLDDALTPPYTGFPSGDFLRAELVDPAKRAYLGVRREGVGVLVLQSLSTSSAPPVLRPEDVIVEWDGTPIDNMGFYMDPDFGRLDFSYLIKGRRNPGDRVPVTLVRDRAEITVQMEMGSRSDDSSLIPEDIEGRPPEYMVEGGFVLRELTARYLQAHGADWVRNVDGRLAHLYLSRQYSPGRPGERVVVISVVLSDPANVGYQHLRNQIVRAVNGEAIRSLQDVFRVAERDRHISRLTLQGIDVDIVLDSAALPAANARLAAAYRIPRLRYQRRAPAAGGASVLP